MIGKTAEVTQIPARRSSFDGSRRRDSVYGLDGSRSERPVLPACSKPWPKVTVVIPTLNEARNLPHVFAKLPAGLHEVIVVDGHSVDDTVATARRLRPDVRIVSAEPLRQGQRPGLRICRGNRRYHRHGRR